MEDSEYYATHHWSYSSIKHLADENFPDTEKALKTVLGKNEGSQSMSLGTAVHSFILDEEPKVFSASSLGFDSFRTKVARESRDALIKNGNTPMSDSEYDKAMEMAEAVKNHPLVQKLNLFGGVHEEGMSFKANGIDFRFKPDSYTISEDGKDNFIVDLKTTQNVALYGGFPKAFRDFDYAIQAVLYANALKEVKNLPFTPKFYFVAVDSSCTVGVFELGIGGEAWTEAVQGIRRAVTTIIQNGWQDPSGLEKTLVNIQNEKREVEKKNVESFASMANTSIIQL